MKIIEMMVLYRYIDSLVIDEIIHISYWICRMAG